MSLVKKSKEDRRQSERRAAEVFLDWYNKHYSTAYTELKDTKSRFPTIRGANWDFVAESVNQDSWIAIECERIWHGEANQEASTWRNLFEKVNQKVGDKLHGTYEVLDIPNLVERLDQKPRNELLEAICKVLLEIDNKNLACDAEVNIWPDIYKELSNWPSYYILKKLVLKKISEKGSEIKIRAFVPHCNIGLLEKQAISKLFSTNSQRVNTQLGAAKQHGAKETIWVIDGYSDLLEDVRREVETIDKKLISNIDVIALVDKSPRAAHVVWSK